MSDFERRTIEEALRQQDMIDRMIGPRGLEALEAYRKYEDLQRPANPELDLIREHQDRMSGVTAQQDALRRAIGPIDLDAARLRAYEGAAALQELVERARGSSALEEPTRAQELLDSSGIGLYGDAMREYGTFTAALQVYADLDGIWREYSGVTELERAMKVASPWIDLQDPLRSISAFQQVSEIGEAVKRLATDPAISFRTLDPLLGGWTPPPGFASWSEVRRFDAYVEAGVDMRMFDIPREAYPDVAREVGIVLPTHSGRVWRSSYVSASEQGRGPVLAVRGSLTLEARRRVIIIELLLRDELEERVRIHYNGQGVEVVIDAKRLEKMERRRAGARFGQSPRLLNHSQFSDLTSTIKAKWNACFADVPIELDELHTLLGNLIELRNALFHHRPLDVREFNVLFAVIARLERAFGVHPHKPKVH